MSWNNIIGQKRAKTILQHALIEKKIPGAYLFHGDSGIGKEALAIQLAKVSNCSNPIINEYEIDSCEKCINCKKMNELTHNNLYFIYPLPTGKASSNKNESPLNGLTEKQIEEIQNQMQEKVQDHYHKIELDNANQIKIASIREIKKKLSMSGNGGGRRFVIISDAEKMTNESSNALLKTLEEPHNDVTLILISSRYEKILQTILSRCQQIKCQPLSDHEIAEFVMNKYQIGQVDANLIAGFAEGSITKAKSFLDKDMSELRSRMIEMFRTSMKGKTYRVDLVNSIEKLAFAKNKNKLELSLSILSLWLRDAFTIQQGGNVNKIFNQDMVESLQKFASFYNSKDIQKAIEVVDKAVLRIGRNVNQQLILSSMFINLRRIFLG